jgi:hypothetical protein
MFFIAEQYGRKSNNKRPHVSTDSSSSYSASGMSISPERLASPTPSSPDLFYLETNQLPAPQPIGAKTLQFGTTETIPTVLFKDKHVERGEVSSETESLIPASPITSKAPAQIQIKVERFEAIANAREADAKTDETTNTSTTATTSTDSNKENETPYAPTSVSPEPDSPEFTNSDVGRGLHLLYTALRTHYGPLRPQTSFERAIGPTWTDDEDEEEEEEDNTDNWGTPNPADQYSHNIGDHPGEGWYLNDPLTKNFYNIEIRSPVTDRVINAPYITFHIQSDRADVSATYGRGHAITTETLKPMSVCYLCPSLTPEQILLLDPAEDFAPAIRKVIDDQFPIHLSAAFVRYQFFKRAQHHAQKTIRLLQDREYRYSERALGVLTQLENANVLGRLCAHEDEVLHELHAAQQLNGRFLQFLQSYTGPTTISALDARANPFRPGAASHHLRPENNTQERPADHIREYCPRCRHAVAPGHNAACKEKYDQQREEDADSTEEYLRARLHRRQPSRIPLHTYKRCHKCRKHGHIRAQCPTSRRPWHIRK